MNAKPWNHNIHYHGLVLGSIPSRCRRALDVGCGTGLLARELAKVCEEVVAIDADHGVISSARTAGTANGRISYIRGDVMTYPFPDNSFDFITAVAALHHLPLKPALTRFPNLLRRGGVLVVVGLYRARAIADYAWAAAAFPTSWMLGFLRGHADVAALVREPQETLNEIRGACGSLLPGSRFRRHLLFRYSVTWNKP